MAWICVYNPSAIQVYRGSEHIGDYDFLKEPYCEKCSSPGVTSDECIVRDLVYGFDRVFSVGEYVARASDPYPLLSTHIRYLKDFNRTDLAIPLGYALYTLMKYKHPVLLDADFCVPVPAHKDKIIERGYNQVELILHNLCEMESPNSLMCLEQIENIKQRGKKLDERYKSVKNAFIFNKKYRNAIEDRHILLIDDVVTSCATVSECSQILLDNGARKVDVLVCGRNRLD